MWYLDLIQLLVETVDSSSSLRSFVPRTSLPPCWMLASFNSLTVEAQVLRDGDLCNSIIPTLYKPGKSTSGNDYHCIWKAYFARCGASNFYPRRYTLWYFQSWKKDTSSTNVQTFLQSGLDHQVALGTIKCQVSATAILFQNCLPLISWLWPLYRVYIHLWLCGNLTWSTLQTLIFAYIRFTSVHIFWQVCLLSYHYLSEAISLLQRTLVL